MKKLALLLLLALCGVAQAQQMVPPVQPVGMGCAYNASPSTLTSGWVGWAQCDSSGRLITSGGSGGSSVNIVAVGGNAVTTTVPVADAAVLAAVQASIPAGTAIIGKVGIDQTTPGTTNLVALTPAQVGAGATAAAAPANAGYMGGLGSGATGGLLAGIKTCDLHAIYTGADNGSKTLVAGVSGRKTYICGFVLSTGTTATTLTLYKGTDADCATSGAAIGPPYALVANDKIGAMSSFWNGFVTATNADYVCINAGAGNQHTAEIWYTIQ